MTYAQVPVTDPTGARILYTTNTGLATLKGLEASGEVPGSRLRILVWQPDVRLGNGRVDQSTAVRNLSAPRAAGLALNRWRTQWLRGMEFGARVAADRSFSGRSATCSPEQRPSLLARRNTNSPATPVSFIRGFYNVTDNLFFTAGVDNLFDRNYYDHLSLRLPPTEPSRDSRVVSGDHALLERGVDLLNSTEGRRGDGLGQLAVVVRLASSCSRELSEQSRPWGRARRDFVQLVDRFLRIAVEAVMPTPTGTVAAPGNLLFTDRVLEALATASRSRRSCRTVRGDVPRRRSTCPREALASNCTADPRPPLPGTNRSGIEPGRAAGDGKAPFRIFDGARSAKFLTACAYSAGRKSCSPIAA